MNILSHEGKFPLETKGSLDFYVPLNRVKPILRKLLFNKHNNTELINKYTEYLLYNDILFFTWKLLPSLTDKTNPNETYIMNYLQLLEKLQLKQHPENQLLCEHGNGKIKLQLKDLSTKRIFLCN
jgi:U3 small nucleolar RNA-associated protein 19